MTNPHEGMACDAVIRLMEQRYGSQCSNISCPENENADPPVDLRFTLGTQQYAMEHTRIEAFERQIQISRQFHELVSPVVEQLNGRMPGPAVYRIVSPSIPNLRRTNLTSEEAQQSLLEWVQEEAQRLNDNNPDVPTRELNPHEIVECYTGTPAGFPENYQVILIREAHWSLSERHYGILFAYPVAPQNLEQQRSSRLRRALSNKCPKLHRCKNRSTRTILILEDSDISLSNNVLIEDALAEAISQRNDLPDEIYLVESGLNRWAVRAMKFGNDLVSDDRGVDFDSTDLVDVMNIIPV